MLCSPIKYINHGLLVWYCYWYGWHYLGYMCHKTDCVVLFRCSIYSLSFGFCNDISSLSSGGIVSATPISLQFISLRLFLYFGFLFFYWFLWELDDLIGTFDSTCSIFYRCLSFSKFGGVTLHCILAVMVSLVCMMVLFCTCFPSSLVV